MAVTDEEAVQAPGESLATDQRTEAIDPADDAQREALLVRFHPLFSGSGGIDSWLREATPQTVVERLEQLDESPLSREQLNQLLVLSHEAEMSTGFFEYYWLSAPEHPYDIRHVAGFDETYSGQTAIVSLEHLRWGLMRFYVDALLYFGNVRSAYRHLREMPADALAVFFSAYRHDTSALVSRGAALPLRPIARDHRYLISEMACKSLAAASGPSQLSEVLRRAYQERVAAGHTASVSVRSLLESAPDADKTQLTFAADDLLDDELTSLAELDAKIDLVVSQFNAARSAALLNTKLYLSSVGDLDVYVATSMRVPDGQVRACADLLRRHEGELRQGRRGGDGTQPGQARDPLLPGRGSAQVLPRRTPAGSPDRFPDRRRERVDGGQQPGRGRRTAVACAAQSDGLRT